MSVKPALYYFNGKGRAEHIRLIFAAAGKEYDDKRLTAEEWAELKPSKYTMYFIQAVSL